MLPVFTIKQRATQLGFDLVGITNASAIAPEQVAQFKKWLAKGSAARMDYLHRNFEKRTNPAKLLDSAESVICVALNYNRPADSEPKPDYPAGHIALYARYEDYHSFIKTRLFQLADFIDSIAENKPRFKICVDSVPLAERALAQRAGLGFIGKNHMLKNPTLGPQLFLGEIITDLKLPPDLPAKTNCGSCTKCLKACPTGALDPAGNFDANKCISYLTIEHKGVIAAEFHKKIGNRLFGCDQCVLACPYCNSAAECKNKDFKYYPERAWLSLQQILELNTEEFDTRYKDSALSRAGLEKLKQTAKICLRNSTA